MSQESLPVEGAGGDHAAQVSNLIARSMANFTGRGPVKVRTTVGPNDVHVVLEDVLTKVETSLVATGFSHQVLETRAAIQDALKPSLVGGVQEIFGREVLAFLSSNHLSPDISIESFVLGAAITKAGGDEAVYPAS